MPEFDSEFSWVADFAELDSVEPGFVEPGFVEPYPIDPDAAGLDQFASPERLIDRPLSAAAVPAASLRGAQFSAGPIEIVQMEAVGHYDKVDASLNGDQSVTRKRSRISAGFMLGVSFLASCSLAAALVGFSLNTGGFETESAGSLASVTTLSQKINEEEPDLSWSRSSTTNPEINQATTELATGAQGSGAMPADAFESPQTVTRLVGRTATSDSRGSVQSSTRQSQARDEITSQSIPSSRSATPATSSGSGRSTTVRPSSVQPPSNSQPRADRDVTNLDSNELVQVGLEPALDRPAPFAAILAANVGGLDLLAADTITDRQAKGSSDVAVDLFTADSDGQRETFVSSTRTGADGSYRIAVPAGKGDSDDCYVMVFMAPAEIGFEVSGQFREVPLCAPFNSQDLPIVRTVDLDVVAATNGTSRSVILTGGPIYLEGTVASAGQAAELTKRFGTGLTGNVEPRYHIIGEHINGGQVAGGQAGSGKSQSIGSKTADEDRVYFKGRQQALFAVNSTKPTETLQRLLRDLAVILGRNPKARLRITVGSDPDLGEAATRQALIGRADEVAKILAGKSIDPGRLEASYAVGRLSGRQLHGDSMSNQIEFLLTWS